MNSTTKIKSSRGGIQVYRSLVRVTGTYAHGKATSSHSPRSVSSEHEEEENVPRSLCAQSSSSLPRSAPLAATTTSTCVSIRLTKLSRFRRRTEWEDSDFSEDEFDAEAKNILWSETESSGDDEDYDNQKEKER